MPEHGPLDTIGAALREGAGDPSPVFMAAVRGRRRRAAAFRAAGTLISTCVIALIALAIALPALRPTAPVPGPVATMPRVAPAAIPTVAMLRRFIDDPGVLDGAAFSAPSAYRVRAGDRPDSEKARALLTLD